MKPVRSPSLPAAFRAVGPRVNEENRTPCWVGHGHPPLHPAPSTKWADCAQLRHGTPQVHCGHPCFRCTASSVGAVDRNGATRPWEPAPGLEPGSTGLQSQYPSCWARPALLGFPHAASSGDDPSVSATRPGCMSTVTLDGVEDKFVEPADPSVSLFSGTTSFS
jgi:hypothetical protein